MKRASQGSVLLLAAACVGCTTSGSGGLILFPLPYHELEETKALKAAHPNPVVWPRELNKNVTGPAVAEPGDLVSIAAVDPAMRAPFVGEQPILLDGTIDLAKYGRVAVGYMTLAEIEAIVNAALKANGGGNLAVTIRFARAPDSKRVYVLGDVVTPGSYPINGNETVLDVILLAGGLTRKADERNIILSRPTPVCDCRVVVPVCHEAIVQWGDTSTNYQVLPGDRIYVPTLPLWNRLCGKLGMRCPPCDACPSPCPIPEERCDSCASPETLTAAPTMEVGLPPAPGLAPAPTKSVPVTPPPGPKLDDRRSPPAPSAPPSLRETPRGATAIPRPSFPAGADFEPIPRPTALDRSKPTMLVDPPVRASTMTFEKPKSTSPAKVVSATDDAKESNPSDWQSPWRPAASKTSP